MINSLFSLSEIQKQSFVIKIYKYLIIGATFALPLNVHLANGLIVGCILPGIILWDKKIKLHTLFIPVLLFLSLALSLIWTENIKEGWRFLVLQLNLLFVPLAFYLGKDFIDEKIEKQVCFAFSLAMVIFLILGYLRVHIETGKWIFFRDTLKYYAIHPGYVSVYILMCYIIFSRLNNNIFLFYFSTLVVFLILIVFSAKNQLICFLVLAFLKLVSIKINLTKTIVFLILSIGVCFYTFQNIKYIKTRFLESEETRLRFFEVAKEGISNNPFLGVGLGDRQEYLDHIRGENSFPWEAGQNSHNQIFDYWISSGIISALLFLAIFVIPIKVFSSQDQFFFLFIIFSASLTESFFYRQVGLVFFLIFYCLFQVRLSKSIKSHINA